MEYGVANSGDDLSAYVLLALTAPPLQLTMGIVHLLQVQRPPGLTYSELFLQVRIMASCIRLGSLVHTTSSNSPQNEDLLPVPEGKRTWGYWNFIALYACSSQASTSVMKLILYWAVAG